MRNHSKSGLGKVLGAVAIGVVLSAGLSGCQDFRQAMGVAKISPDEFAIVTKAPLVMPPDFALRPPQPGIARPFDDVQAGLAQDALFGTNVQPVADGVVTAGEFALLTNTGAGSADPNIRNVLASETTAIVQKDRGFADSILFWQNQEVADDASVVNAGAEAERLRENEAAGRPVTSGATPTISKDRGLF